MNRTTTAAVLLSLTLFAVPTYAWFAVALVWVATVGLVSHLQPNTFAPKVRGTAGPYAQIKWVNLGELVPRRDADDHYIRLIAIEGDVDFMGGR